MSLEKVICHFLMVFLGVLMVNFIRLRDSTVFKLFVKNLLDLVDQGAWMERQNIFHFAH